MDRHTCKLCFRRFSNGRALGGHMRSHVTSAAATATKPQLHDPASPSSSVSASHRELEASEQVAEVADQATTAALMADREVAAGVEDEAKQLAVYALRENPRKSFRLVDPEFSSIFPAVDYVVPGGSSIVLQDRESETESSKPPSLRRRSKRRRRALQTPATTGPEPSFEPEPVSSVSDASPEEDVARCLMMLSRDAWTSSCSPDAKSKDCKKDEVEEEEEDEDEEEQPSDGDDSEQEEEELIAIVRSRTGGRSRFQCGTCRKVFRSYQALGGHRASHKKVKACIVAPPSGAPVQVAVDEEEDDDVHAQLDNQIQDAVSAVNAAPSTGSTDRKNHECPVCFRTFASGQALGGHKRSHLSYSTIASNPSVVTAQAAAAPSGVADATTTAFAPAASVTAICAVQSSHAGKLAGESLLDLNLPPPVDEEVELSAVFDAEQ